MILGAAAKWLRTMVFVVGKAAIGPVGGIPARALNERTWRHEIRDR